MNFPASSKHHDGMDSYDRAYADLDDCQQSEEIYGLIDRLAELVEHDLPCMRCVPGCSDCCRQQVLAGFDEWRIAHAWILENLDVETQRAIVGKAEALLLDAESAIPVWMRLRGMDDTTDEYLRTINGALRNQSTPCPFLECDRCSIYAARPSICRAYGRMMRTEESGYYCEKILLQMESGPVGIDDMELPVFQPYHRAVLDRDSGQLDEVNVLPVWVLAHRASDGTLRTVTHRIDPASPFPVVDGYWSYDDDE